MLIENVLDSVHPQIQETDLFSDVRLRREQSKVLYRHLLLLNALIVRAEREKDIHSHTALSKGLKIFVTEYIHLLMYRDWAEFEAIADRILNAKDAQELGPLLRQFSSYLETLIGHVRTRAVFAEIA